MNKSNQRVSYILQTLDDIPPNLGEGISRTSSNNAKLHELLIKQGKTPPIKEWIRATSKKEALQFAANRHPTATSITYIALVK